MLESIFHAGSFNLLSVVLSMTAALIMGLLIALCYKMTEKSGGYLPLVLAVMPLLVAVIILLINGNLGTSVAVLGAFGLVRFRSAPGSAKEIVSIFLAMATGLATAKGYIALAAVFVIVISLIMIISTYVRFKEKDDLVRELKITIPEDLNYAHEFDDLFDTYTKRSKLLNVKTTNMGSLYKLSYEVELKSEDNVQSFIDDLRTRNGNLEIAVLLPAVSEGVL